MYPDYVSQDFELDQAFKHIVDALISRGAQFLFGAGMSQSSKVPNGGEALELLLKDYFPPGGNVTPSVERLSELVWEFPFEAALQAIERTPYMGREGLTKKLKEVFLNDSFRPSQAHHDFLSICWGEGGRPRLWNILTTNFDNLLEQVIGEDRAVRITEKNAKDIKEAQQKGKIPVVHIHGVLDEEYQATELDVFSQDYRILYHEFEAALHYSDAFVFVGYSMNDPDFRSIYLRYRERIQGRKRFPEKKTYVVSPPKDEFSYALGKPLWDSRGAIWIPLKAETFFARLKYFLEIHYDALVRDNVMKKYNLAREQELEQFIDRTSEVLRIDRADALRFLYEALPRGGGR